MKTGTRMMMKKKWAGGGGGGGGGRGGTAPLTAFVGAKRRGERKGKAAFKGGGGEDSLFSRGRARRLSLSVLVCHRQ